MLGLRRLSGLAGQLWPPASDSAADVTNSFTSATLAAAAVAATFAVAAAALAAGGSRRRRQHLRQHVRFRHRRRL